MGNIHPQVTEPLIQEVFASAGPVEGCKLIRKEKVAYYLFGMKEMDVKEREEK